jgi:hypothetical protein
MSTSSTETVHEAIRVSCFFLLLVIGALLTWQGSVGYWKVHVTFEGIGAAFQMLLAALILWLVGAVLLQRFVFSRVKGSEYLLRFGGRVGWHIVSLVAGQLACQILILCRAALSGTCFFVSRTQLPITKTELVILGALIAAAAIQGAIRGGVRSHLSSRLGGFCGFLALLALAIIPLVIRELPRNVTLSSDPDQHAFWAQQVLRNGGIPWDQGILGIGSFGYPAGFAALNAIWCFLSRLSPVEVVTVQPQIQFVVALLLIAALSARLMPNGMLNCWSDSPQNPSWRTLLVGFGLCGAYWYYLPYGLQQMYYHNSGTARSAATLLSVIPVLSWLVFPIQSEKPSYQLARISVTTAAVIVLATFNPIIVLFPVIIAAGIVVFEFKSTITSARRGFVHARHLGMFLVIVVALPCIALGDPYFGEALEQMLFGQQREKALGSTLNAMQVTGSFWILPTESLWHRFAPSRLFSLLFGDALPADALSPALQLLLAAGIVYWCIRAPQIASRYVGALVVLSLACYATLGIPSSTGENTPLYLVRLYLFRSFDQNGVLLGCIGLAVLLRFIVGDLSLQRTLFATVVVTLFWMRSAPPAVAHNSHFNMTPRVGYCGSMGCVSPSDLSVIQFISDFGQQVLSQYPDLTYKSAPKILILGDMAQLGVETWVFPSGASRILPLKSVLPVAFFYGRGSPEWSYDNYRKNICHQFNETWLRVRNIRYLFIPSQQGGCLRGREKVLEGSKVLFQQDKARFVQLF